MNADDLFFNYGYILKESGRIKGRKGERRKGGSWEIAVYGLTN